MHKARENNNGTFSIGKTWSLDDLTAVQSYVYWTPRTAEEAKHKDWAKEVGFTVTLAKPYYWQAGTAKEKEFFIASLVKIFKKYTTGQVPELIGFSPREIDSMVGGIGARSEGSRPPGSAGQSPARPPPLNRPSPSPGIGRGMTSPSVPDLSQAARSRDPSGARRPPTAPADERPLLQQQQRSVSGQSATSLPPALQTARQARPRPSMEAGLRKPPSREQLRPYPGAPSPGVPPPPAQLKQNITPQSSRSDFAGQRSASPEASSVSSKAPSIPPLQEGRAQFGSKPSKDSLAPTNGLGAPAFDRPRPNGDISSSSRDASPEARRTPQSQLANNMQRPGMAALGDEPARKPTPERKRPPMLTPEAQRSNGVPIPSPLQTPRSKGIPLDTRGTSPSSVSKLPPNQRMPGTFTPSPAGSETMERNAVLPGTTPPPAEQPGPLRDRSPARKPVPAARAEPSPAPRAPSPPPPAPTEPVEPEPAPSVTSPPVASPPSDATSPLDEEQHRPGLGPMFKEKKDVAGAFRKAAKATMAFKPRAGGAAEKLRKQREQELSGDGQDGISGVFVPAPLSRGVSNDTKPGTPDVQSKENLAVKPVVAEVVPQLKVTSPVSAPSGATTPFDEAPAPQRSTSPGAQASKEAEDAEKERRKQKRRSNVQSKYISSLGIDPSLLDGRGLEFESMLGDFGWGGSSSQSKKLEHLEADIRREISRVEAGSWLGMEQKDERVELVEKMLDKAITECDELEGLLTLYGVELSVSVTI